MTHDSENSVSTPIRLKTRLGVIGWIRLLATSAVLLAAIWFMTDQIMDAWEELQTRSLAISPTWVAVSSCLYGSALFALGLPWLIALRDRERLADEPLRVSTRDLLSIYVISHVGKYIPGKAFVLLIRYGMTARHGMSIGMAAITTFLETISSMGTAAILGAVIFLVASTGSEKQMLAEHAWLIPSALGVGAFFIGAILPPVFTLLPRMTSTFVPTARRHAEVPLRWSTLWGCVLCAAVAWSLAGLAFYASVEAVSTSSLLWRDVPIVVGAFSISYVAGFISMVPGHLGVRDAVLDFVILPVVGGDKLVAVSATLLFRVITIVVELVLAVILYLTIRDGSAKLQPELPPSAPA